MSRQSEWQRRKGAEGKCKICAKPRDPDSNHFCAAHLEAHRNHSRNAHRIRNGIPLDAPLSKRGRPKGKSKDVLERKLGGLAEQLRSEIRHHEKLIGAAKEALAALEMQKGNQ